MAEETAVKKPSSWRILGQALRDRKTGFMLLFGFASGPQSWKRLLHPPVVRVWRARRETERVEAAATRALEIGARTYGSVKSILDNNLDRQAAPRRTTGGQAILHPNIRGARYYH